VQCQVLNVNSSCYRDDKVKIRNIKE
jgi:hypothetical protein